MRPFTDVLRDIAGGALVAEAGTEFSDLVLAVDDQAKTGEITLTIKLKPAGHKSGAMDVSYTIKTKKPVGARPSSVMWGTPEGTLVASDPRQQKLDLRDASKPAAAGADLKTVNG